MRFESSEEKENFNILDFQATFRFRTASSIGFYLGSFSARGGTVFGDIQVHHPCEGHMKAYIYVHLPAKHRNSEHALEIKKRIFQILDIPSDETFELNIHDFEEGFIISRHEDRDGFTDGAEA